MRLKFLMLILLFTAGCAAQPVRAPRPAEPVQPQPSVQEPPRPGPETLGRDAQDCERQALLAGVGDRARAFDECMRNRGRTPGR